jgi:hypothetical protein
MHGRTPADFNLKDIHGQHWITMQWAWHGSPLGVKWREGLEVGDLVEVTGLVGTLAEDDEAHIVLLLVGDPLTSTGGEKAEAHT